MSKWNPIILEVCERPDEGDPVQWVSMHILQWEKMRREYSIDIKDVRLVYERKPGDYAPSDNGAKVE